MTATPWKLPIPGHLAAAVSLGRFPVTVIDALHGIMAWHCRWAGTARFADGSSATWTAANLKRIGTTDICVVRFAAPATVKPVVIIPELPGFMRTAAGALRPLKPSSEGNTVTWPKSVGLVNGDSGSPGLADLGASGYVGCYTFATSYTVGPRLWTYKYAIEAAKQ